MTAQTSWRLMEFQKKFRQNAFFKGNIEMETLLRALSCK